ncbi:MAG: hypothetical protein ACRDQ1_17465, partial [Sciscionella sp.]
MPPEHSSDLPFPAPPPAPRSCSGQPSERVPVATSLGRVSGMRTLRTPDDRFRDLPEFDLKPDYADVPDGAGGTLRMAYV